MGSPIEISREPANSPDAQWCLTQYAEELSDRFDMGFDPARSISASSEELTPPNGVFLIARLDERPVGCGALKVKASGIGEIKRMWVDEEVRGMGVGRRLLDRIQEEARGFGLNLLRLETNRTLTEARHLYRSFGFEEVPAFSDEPYAHHWFEKAL